MPYYRKRAYRHSCAPSSVPFNLDSCNVSHAPVFVARLSQRAPWTGGPARVSSRASSSLRTLRFCTAVLTLRIQAEWSTVQGNSWPLRAAKKCPVMTQDVVQAVFVISGRFSTACFTGICVTPLPGIPSPRPWMRTGMKLSRSACSAKPKESLIIGVTRCTNTHSFWSDFCSPV